MRKKQNQTKIWLTWEKQIRNRSMSKTLNIKLYEVLSEETRLVRYAVCILKSIEIIKKNRPKIVISPNPSLILTFIMLLSRHIFGFKHVIDAHYGGIEAYNNSRLFQIALDICNRKADLVIVTNDQHAEHVSSLGGRSFVFPDPLPDLSLYHEQIEEVTGKIFFICSFDRDEPFLAVFRAAETLLSEGFHFFVSGNYQKAGINPRDWPGIRILGFISENEFYGHIFTSQMVIDLTDNDNCLVCGAYESLAAGKPIILSNKKALKDYFKGGVIFTENHTEDIIKAVKIAFKQRRSLAESCKNWVVREKKEINRRKDILNQLLEIL